jgi:hypothetical protein
MSVLPPRKLPDLVPLHFYLQPWTVSISHWTKTTLLLLTIFPTGTFCPVLTYTHTRFQNPLPVIELIWSLPCLKFLFRNKSKFFTIPTKTFRRSWPWL